MPGYKILSAGPAFAQLVGRFAAARHEGKATDHTSMQPMSYGSYFYATDELWIIFYATDENRYLCKDLPFSRSNQIYLRNEGGLNSNDDWEIYIYMPGYKILSAGPAFAPFVGRFAAMHKRKATDHISMQPSYFYATSRVQLNTRSHTQL